MYAIAWPLSGLFMCAIAAILGEMVSTWPVAGAMFTWVFRLSRSIKALDPWARYLSWMTGSFLLCSHILLQVNSSSTLTCFTDVQKLMLLARSADYHHLAACAQSSRSCCSLHVERLLVLGHSGNLLGELCPRAWFSLARADLSHSLTGNLHFFCSSQFFQAFSISLVVEMRRLVHHGCIYRHQRHSPCSIVSSEVSASLLAFSFSFSFSRF